MTSRSVFKPLPVLVDLAGECSRLNALDLSDVGFVCVQHLLETTGSLLEVLLELGAIPRNMFVLGKSYSSNLDVATRLKSLGIDVCTGSAPIRPGGFGEAVSSDIEELWQRAETLVDRRVRTLIILDDGGRCLECAPDWCLQNMRTVGIEQTQSGMARLPLGRLPIINVAKSAAKKYVEAPQIGRAIASRMDLQLNDVANDSTFGVVGLGPIGRAVVAELNRANKEVFSYDPGAQACRPNGSEPSIPSPTFPALLSCSDVVLGCTGDDLFRRAPANDAWFERCRYLVSCSSEDTEYLSLLIRYGQYAWDDEEPPCASVICRIGRHEVTILRGGFPINFDGSLESVPAAEIQLTRGLLLAAIYQAVALARDTRRLPLDGIQLSAWLQRYVCTRWLHHQPTRRADYIDRILWGMRRESWIAANSEGHRIEWPKA